MTSANATDQAAAGGPDASDLDALDEFSEKLDAFKVFRSNDSDDQPLAILWESIGAAGDPPRDQAKTFALMSLVIMAVAAVAVPVIAAIVFFTS